MSQFIVRLSVACYCGLLSAMLFAANPTASTPDSFLLKSLYQKYKPLTLGKNADYIPALAKQNPNLFAIALVTTDGKITTIGDADVAFPMESIVKPFLYLLALHDHGAAQITNRISFNPTGLHFNSIIAIEQQPNHSQNALVNAGAILTTSLIKGETQSVQWQRIVAFMDALSGEKLALGEAVYQSETATNTRNHAITSLLASYGVIASNREAALDNYTKACSLLVTAKQLAIIGATLANGGVNPITKQAVTSAPYVKAALAQMVMNGLYENSGTWFYNVGIPAKSGVSGGILAIVPNRLAIVVFSPRLDEAGNSVRAQAVIKAFSQAKHLHLLDKAK